MHIIKHHSTPTEYLQYYVQQRILQKPIYSIVPVSDVRASSLILVQATWLLGLDSSMVQEPHAANRTCKYVV